MHKPIIAACVALLAGCGGSEGDERHAASKAAERRAASAALVAESRSYLEAYADRDDVIKIGLAEQAAHKALAADSTLPAFIQLARVRLAQRRYEDAAGVLVRVISEDRYDASVWGMLGDASLCAGHYADADSSYRVMNRIDDGFDSSLRLARWKRQFGEYDDAVALIDRAVDRAEGLTDRRAAEAYADLSRIFFVQGYLEAALDNIDRSLDLLPEVAPRLALRAEILRVSGRLAESGAVYERLVDLSPHPHYRALLSRVHYEEGDTARADSLVAAARDGYEKLMLKYQSVIVRRYVAFLLEFDVDREKALELAHALSRKRRDIYSYELLAWAYFKNGQPDRAWSSIGLALRRGATDPRVVYRASVIARAAGKDERAQVFAERARGLNPLAEQMYDTGR